jgi:glycine/D-amino acid oxidase-like deaminating enzyme
LSRARDLGATYLSKARATSFLIHGERIRGVQTEAGAIHAPVVIAATGPWTRPLMQHTGFDPPIETEYHQVAILKNAPNMKSGSACIDSVTATYFRSDGGDKFLIGDFYGKRPVDPDNFPQRAADTDLEEIIERASRRVPKIENAEVMRGVTGVYDMTPDARPLLGQVPGVEGLYICAGFSGMGFKISPAIGLVISELILDGAATTVDISAFRPTRFAEGEPIKAEFEYKDD